MATNIIFSQLVTTNSLEEYFVDKSTGFPLAAGVITLYRDDARTVLKNWYYQVDAGGNAYTYIALPNPLTLSSVGTIVDVNGNDVEPFYYPFSEDDNTVHQPYYITVDNANGQRQFVRENFPFSGTTETPGESIPTLTNYIVNNNFWRNCTKQDLTNTTSTVAIGGLCPSAHDGFSMPDLQFFKGVAGGIDIVEFKKFNAGEIPFNPTNDINQDVTPEFYLNHTCTTIQAGEGFKYYQWPIVLHIKNLETLDAIFTLDAKVNNGNVNNVINMGIYQFLGSGTTPSPLPTSLNPITLGSSWAKYPVNFKFPSASGITPSPTGDDALYLILMLPTDVTLDISFTNPSIYLGSTAPTNNYQTYDQTDTIINSWRTGDFRTSLNSFGNGITNTSRMSNFGWVCANDGTIGDKTSTATNRANIDTWPLYNLIWNNVPRMYAPVIGGAGANAFSDFTSQKPLQLTKSLGRVLAGLNPLSNLPLSFTVTLTPTTFTVSAPTFIITVANNFTAGQAFQVSSTGTLPGGLFPNITYYVSAFNLTTSSIEITETLSGAVTATDNSNSIFMTSSGTGVQSITNTINKLALSSLPSPDLTPGTPVVVSSTATLPSVLSANTVYFVATGSSGANLFLSDNYDDAIAGYALPIVSLGSGIFTVSSALGATIGESAHTQTILELAKHTHFLSNNPTQPGAIATNQNSPPPLFSYGTGATSGFADILPTGNSSPFNIIQPTTMVNVFLKL